MIMMMSTDFSLPSLMLLLVHQVARKAALYRQLQKQKQEVQEKEFQDLIECGLNPYEISRRKDIEDKVRGGESLLGWCCRVGECLCWAGSNC